MKKLTKEIPIIFPAHSRTAKQIKIFKLIEMINYEENFLLNELDKINQTIRIIPPLGYLDFLCLISNATIVLTVSGGIQEETTILGIPCLTLRNSTKKPITAEEKTNILVGNDSKKFYFLFFLFFRKYFPVIRRLK